MGAFRSTFLGFGRTGPVCPDAFKALFQNNDSKLWDAEGGGGGIQYVCDGPSLFTLNFGCHPDHGLALIYTSFDRSTKKFEKSLCSVYEAARLTDLVEASDEQFIGIGHFVPVDMAWRALQEFFDDPGKPPSSINWMMPKDASGG